MKTRVTELLGIEAPIIQGGMARVADASLAAAVSEAGGLGIIACGGAKLDWIAEQVEQAQAQTDKPFGCNIMLMDPLTPEVAKLVVELGVKVVTTGAGSPVEYLPMWRDAGIKVIPVIATTAQARRMERLGVDAVVAEGTECWWSRRRAHHHGARAQRARGRFHSRHRRRRHRRRSRHLRGLRVGCRGRADGHALPHHRRVHRVRPVEGEGAGGAKDSDTIVTGRGTGHPVRGLKNKFARACRKREMEASSP